MTCLNPRCHHCTPLRVHNHHRCNALSLADHKGPARNRLRASTATTNHPHADRPSPPSSCYLHRLPRCCMSGRWFQLQCLSRGVVGSHGTLLPRLRLCCLRLNLRRGVGKEDTVMRVIRRRCNPCVSLVAVQCREMQGVAHANAAPTFAALCRSPLGASQRHQAATDGAMGVCVNNEAARVRAHVHCPCWGRGKTTVAAASRQGA
jgi:hypothetical protein